MGRSRLGVRHVVVPSQTPPNESLLAFGRSSAFADVKASTSEPHGDQESPTQATCLSHPVAERKPKTLNAPALAFTAAFRNRMLPMPLPDTQIESAGAGRPVAVFYGPAAAWSPVWPALAEWTQVCRYHRAENNRPTTARDIVNDMRSALLEANAAAPYVLIGHSFGGMLMQLYARLWPAEVAALVLIDSVHQNQVQKFYDFSQEAGDGLVAEIAEVHKFVDYAASERQLQSAPPMRRDMPLIVISRGKKTDVAKVWSELQADLAQLSDNTQHIIATQSGHGILFDEPDVVLSATRAAARRL
jgi:pimeloyl-ACP methyl ester carboxylesterase